MILTSPSATLFSRIKSEMVSLGVWYSTAADEAAFRTWFLPAWINSGCTSDFAVLVQPSAQLSIQFGVRVGVTGHRANVYWGDGTTDSVAPSADVDTSLSKTYATGAVRAVVLIGKIVRFSSINSDGKTAFGGRIGCLTSLTSLNVQGSNTLSGPVAGFTLLTVLYVTGANTLSGPVAGFTSMSFLYVTGANTLSGWGALAASATGLCQMTHGGLTVLDATEVNAVLAGFWANRDAAKSRTERVIDLGKDTPTPNAAPTGQGLIDKAALQGYRSPTPPGTAGLWTVTTN
ncbi:MAG: hypothetical protein ABFD89_18715 [Bryobacteraceae bacterium]